MTKQEKIWEEMVGWMCSRAYGGTFLTRVDAEREVKMLLDYLKSESVKFVGELPSIMDGKGEVMSALEYKKKLVIEELI